MNTRSSRWACVLLMILSGPGCAGDSTGDGDDGDGGSDGAVEDGGDGSGSEGDGDGGASSDDGSADGSDDTAGNDVTGEELFVSLCAPCHGSQAEGTALGYELRHHDPAHFEWVLRNGRPGLEFGGSIMAAYSEDVVSPSDAAKILDFLASFPQPDTAEGLYLDYCGNCHGATPGGGLVEEDIVGKSLHDITEKVREGENPGMVGERQLYMPSFDSEHLTDDELASIESFING